MQWPSAKSIIRTETLSTVPNTRPIFYFLFFLMRIWHGKRASHTRINQTGSQIPNSQCSSTRLSGLVSLCVDSGHQKVVHSHPTTTPSKFEDVSFVLSVSQTILFGDLVSSRGMPKETAFVGFHDFNSHIFAELNRETRKKDVTLSAASIQMILWFQGIRNADSRAQVPFVGFPPWATDEQTYIGNNSRCPRL